LRNATFRVRHSEPRGPKGSPFSRIPPKVKHKAAPKPTAVSELASALGVAKFSRIKHGDLQHEANVKRSFTVPGSYWNAQCTDGDENQMYSAQVVEVCLTHKFQGTSMRQPAVRFVLTGAAASTVDDSPLWIALDEYSKLTDKIRRTEREDADKAAEAAKVAASGINEVVQAGGGAADEEVEFFPTNTPITRCLETLNFRALCNHRADHHKRASRSRLGGVQPVGQHRARRHEARRPRWRRRERGKALRDATLAVPPDRLGIANRVRSPPIFFSNLRILA
jgi:hypothetical protein